ncbi:MAG: hypothetical protein L3J03_01660 [Desulfobacterales bacterium]|nr:hypothetical protein [Desulfobacterales bacterium]
MPASRKKFWGLVAGIILAVLLISAGALWRLSFFFPALSPQQEVALAFYLGGAVLLLITAMAIFGILLDQALFRPLGAVIRGVGIITESNPTHRLEIPGFNLLDELPDALHRLGDRLHNSRREVGEALATGATRVEEQKAWLEAVVREIHEGVVVCHHQARILLYNPAAQRLLDNHEALGLGRSLYAICARGPIEHTLGMLLQHRRDNLSQPAAGIEGRFLCPTVNGAKLLQCQMELIPGRSAAGPVFVITFDEVALQTESPGLTDISLRGPIEALRGPLASLRAAAENLVAFPDMAPVMRSAFENVIAQESSELTDRFEKLVRDCRLLTSTHNSLTDINSGDLFKFVSRRLRETGGPELASSGMPLWFRGDSHSLMLVLTFLAQRIKESSQVTSLSAEALLGDRRVYLALAWPGKPVLPAEIDKWLQQPLPGSVGDLKLADILARHGSNLWSQSHRREGWATLRIPVPISPRQWRQTTEQAQPARPEFYDFSLAEMHGGLGELADRPLNQCTFTVFDTETTGLEPSAGDEIVSLGAVRIVNQRIVKGETFTRMVNPGRTIPKSSVRFHGITDEMIKDQPLITEILPLFKNFVGESVLVAHNAAFDMKFIQLKEDAAGVRFANPILDTLLLSVFLHDHTRDHYLDAIADRLGVEVRFRHTALGDATVTAEIFIRLLDLLKQRGILTLGQAMAAADKMIAVRKQQTMF